MTQLSLSRTALLTRTVIGLALGAALLGGCTAPATNPSAPDTALERLAPISLEAGEQAYLVDGEASVVRFFVYRGGRLARLGHNHVVVVRGLTGNVAVTGQRIGSRFRLSIPLANVDIDNAQERQLAGEEFSSRPSEEDIAATRDNMLGDDGLFVSRFPTAEIAGTLTSRDGDQGVLSVDLQIYGQTVRQNVPVGIIDSAAGITVAGELRLTQSSFGITPFSVLGGAIIVLDEVLVRFELLAAPGSS
jgi:hypothetical protein